MNITSCNRVILSVFLSYFVGIKTEHNHCFSPLFNHANNLPTKIIIILLVELCCMTLVQHTNCDSVVLVVVTGWRSISLFYVSHWAAIVLVGIQGIASNHHIHLHSSKASCDNNVRSDCQLGIVKDTFIA